MPSSKKILVHTVSVGEFLGSISYIYELKNNFPGYEILVSTTTLSSNRIAKKKIGNDFKVLHFPLDFSWAVKRFLKKIFPSLIILVETELWPNFLWTAGKRNIPVVVANGRISEHSYRNYSKAKKVFANMCRGIDAWGVQFERDKSRLVDLGIKGEKIFVNGSMKYDAAIESARNVKEIKIYKGKNQFLTGGSTHSGEEEILLRIYKDIKPRFKDLILILAPRHTERTEEVEELIKENNLTCIKRSFCTAGTDISKHDVFLVDTMGELMSIYGISDIVFIGKSLVKGGGQNLLEPAALRKAIVCGPLMGNFIDITLWLLQNKGIIQVKDEIELKEVIVDLLKDTKKCAQLGDRARELVFQGKGAVDRNIELVKNVLNS
jgi:3-deoxy-D-manno-octulosonic-acid transferase